MCIYMYNREHGDQSLRAPEWAISRCRGFRFFILATFLNDK